MPYVAVRDIPHYYEWVVAASEPQDKPVMVFLHGWGGSARYWKSTAEALTPYFNCLLYDLRGFGRSQPSDKASAACMSPQDCKIQFAIETYADDLAQLLGELNLGPVFINAHSTGSSMALFFLNRYPELAQKAILTCHGIFEYEAKSFQQFHQFGTYVVQFRPKWLYRLPGVDRLFMARFLHQSIPPVERKAFLEDFLMADFGAALGTMFSAVSEQASVTMPQEFVKLKVPTLMVSGEYDQIIPVPMAQKAANLSEKVEFKVIPNTGHFPMLEDSEGYLQSVLQFLQIS